MREPNESERGQSGDHRRRRGSDRRFAGSFGRWRVCGCVGVWVCGCRSAARRFGRVCEEWEGYVHRTRVLLHCGRAWEVTYPSAAPTQCAALCVVSFACLSGFCTGMPLCLRLGSCRWARPLPLRHALSPLHPVSRIASSLPPSLFPSVSFLGASGLRRLGRAFRPGRDGNHCVTGTTGAAAGTDGGPI